MIGRRATVGLSLLSALLFCAFAAQSALGAPVESTKTTFATCAPVAGQFSDAHCDNKTAGNFKHEVISINTQTKISATNQNVTNSTTSPEPAVLSAKVPGGKATITCQTVANDEAVSFIENKEPEAGRHKVRGTARTQFGNTAAETEDCKVTELAKCRVKEPIISMAEIEGLEKVEGPEPVGEGKETAMGLRFTGEENAAKEKVFAEIEFKNNLAGEACSLNGTKLKVTGSVIATNGPTTASAQNNEWSGATLVFTPEFEMESNLKLGAEPAKFKTIITPRMAPSGNPISMTTTPGG
jgi:hypothetical protein